MIQQREDNLLSNLAVGHGIINEEICRCKYVSEQERSKIVCLKYSFTTISYIEILVQ